MIYSTSDVARHSRPSLQGAATALQEAGARVRNAVQSAAAQTEGDGPALRLDISADPLARVTESVKAQVVQGTGIEAVRAMASAASQQLAGQVLPMANDRPQALATVG